MEKSGSGEPIHRYTDRKREFEHAIGDGANIDAISAHIERYIGPVASVFHEVVSDLVHIDVHVVAPNAKRDFYTLVTSGMSDRAMKAPVDHPELKYSELMICLPPHWPMSDAAWGNEDHYWPIRWLKVLARFPHEYLTWLWAMHTVPNGDPAEPLASNTGMTGFILLPALTVPPGFRELRVNEERMIHFHAMVPLFPDEMALKLDKGADALIEGFDRNGVTELFDPQRKSVVRGKRSWFHRVRWW
ncbi:MAG TPA: suppressor of fused domain protein [Flavobacteriales bacterium]